MRRSREEWKVLVAELRESGLTTSEFARRRGLKLSTLRWWCSELRDEGGATVEFLAVRPAGVAPRPYLEAAVGSVVVRFEAGTDTEYLASLLSRLSSAC